MLRTNYNDPPAPLEFADRARHHIGLTLALLALVSWIAGPNARGSGAASLNESGSPSEEVLYTSSQTTLPGKLHPYFLEPSRGGIREVIAGKYKKRYQQWKHEFLSTEAGRRQWEVYAHHPYLVITLTVSPNNSHGGKTGSYEWDDSGKMIAATITLGDRIDQGYPDSGHYPVTNSLNLLESSYLVSANTLAATKIAHEFGHINRTATTDIALFQLQNRLMPVYRSILLANGHDALDPRLIGLAPQMGGRPEEIIADREFWAEANALRYLRERISDKRLQRSLFKKIKENIYLCDTCYGQRFLQNAQSQSLLP